MGEFTGHTNDPNEGQIEIKATAGWSQRRCYHDDEIEINVRSERIQDGETVELKVFTKKGKIEIDLIGAQEITASKLDHTYKIDWKQKPFGDKREFLVTAKVGQHLVSEKSPPLFVELDEPGFSF